MQQLVEMQLYPPLMCPKRDFNNDFLTSFVKYL